MPGFRLTNNGNGCPPIETPPSGYKSPFYEDSSGRLWIKSCFKSFQYFGAARHDLTTGGAPGSQGFPINVEGDVTNGNGITAGKYTNRTITNTTNCTIGILLGHALICDWQISVANWVFLTLSERWNGQNVATASVTSEFRVTGDKANRIYREYGHSGASPHSSSGAETGETGLILAPGQSATVGAKLMLRYLAGYPAPGEMIFSAASAVRIYGYVIG